MSNKDYIINVDSFNSVSPVTEANNKPKSEEPNPNIAEGVNFKVKSGFENVVSTSPFSVSLSSDLTDFGTTLSPTNPIIRTVDLDVYNPSLYGYSIVTSQDHSLKGEKESIPDTTCDNGDCNQENSGLWTNTLTYGFGYRCDTTTGIDCDNSFSNAESILSGSNFYKSFANISSGQLPQSVIAGIGAKNKGVRLSYKVNISGTQAQGAYTNIITYIAVPNF